MALELRPNCEWCDKDLPPAATDARICSYECTFCADCVDRYLQTSVRTAAVGSHHGRSGRRPSGATDSRSPIVRPRRAGPAVVEPEEIARFAVLFRAIPPERR